MKHIKTVMLKWIELYEVIIHDEYLYLIKKVKNVFNLFKLTFVRHCDTL